MDLFEHRYYRLNKRLMTLIGQWPYQSTRVRRILLAVIIAIVIGQMIPEILASVKYYNDRKIILEDVISLLFTAVWGTKLIIFVWNSQKTSILCTAAIYSTTFVFLSQPVTPKIIDILLKNGTEPGKFPLPVDYYYFDEQKYYFYIIMYSSVCVCMAATILIASDVMLITYVQHACGILAALGHKLERIGTNDTSEKKGESSYTMNKKHMSELAWYIDKHNDAIEYADLIEATHKWGFFFIIGFGMIMIITIALEVLLNTSDSEASIRFIAYALSGIFHFYIECYISQMLMDHSIGIHFYIHNSRWYRLSPKAQKLMQFMTMRCGVPCKLTVGGFFEMSVRTFGLTVKTGMSYFTLVRTMQI